MVSTANEVVIYSTSMGSIGAFYPFETKEVIFLNYLLNYLLYYLLYNLLNNLLNYFIKIFIKLFIKIFI